MEPLGKAIAAPHSRSGKVSELPRSTSGATIFRRSSLPIRRSARANGVSAGESAALGEPGLYDAFPAGGGEGGLGRGRCCACVPGGAAGPASGRMLRRKPTRLELKLDDIEEFEGARKELEVGGGGGDGGGGGETLWGVPSRRLLVLPYKKKKKKKSPGALCPCSEALSPWEMLLKCFQGSGEKKNWLCFI